jgi:hypothetical protein
MNLLKLTSLSLLLSGFAAPGAPAQEPFRTDINPALLYQQGFMLMPELSPEDHAYLFTTEWRGRRLEDRYAKLVAKYDNSFKLLRRAAHSQVPCDWGIDLSDGPEAMLPGLARAKSATQAACLRARYALQQEKDSEARDDLIAVFALGRNVSKDGVLISALVQIAIENIVTSFIADNFYRFRPETLRQLVAGFDAAPTRGSIQQCVATEKHSFCDWYIRKIESFQSNHPGDQKATLDYVGEICRRSLLGEENPDPDFADNLIKAAGGTPEGVIKYIKELYPLYDELAVVVALPYDQYTARIKPLTEKIAKHPNLLVEKFFPSLEKCRFKEFGSLVRLAMLRAAVEYRLRGEEGFRSVQDPCGSSPFKFERFTLDGVDRGFQLRSELDWRGFEETTIFVETRGPIFYLDGPKAGKSLAKQPEDK